MLKIKVTTTHTDASHPQYDESAGKYHGGVTYWMEVWDYGSIGAKRKWRRISKADYFCLRFQAIRATPSPVISRYFTRKGAKVFQHLETFSTAAIGTAAALEVLAQKRSQR